MRRLSSCPRKWAKAAMSRTSSSALENPAKTSWRCLRTRSLCHLPKNRPEPRGRCQIVARPGSMTRPSGSNAMCPSPSWSITTWSFGGSAKHTWAAARSTRIATHRSPSIRRPAPFTVSGAGRTAMRSRSCKRSGTSAFLKRLKCSDDSGPMTKHDSNRIGQEIRKEHSFPAVSAVLSDGTIVEMVFEPISKRTSFVLAKDGESRIADSVALDERTRLVPYSPRNNILAHDVVLFPSEPEEYGSEEELLREIESFIHRYVDLSPLFEKIASYYVLLTWVYERFNELPYLRLRGEPGSGKTRFLLTVGSLRYKPMFASGASTVSPLFRIIDSFRGTLVIDEGDFRLSDERAEIVKILNNGNARGFPVLRTEVSYSREFNPKAYSVFGPKLVATRGFFEDRALESRCITEEMGQTRLRADVPINLPAKHKTEALHLRNKLLLFRFRNLHRPQASEQLVDRTIEPRLNQVFVPLMSIIEDPQARVDLQELARRYNREMISDRGMDMEAQVLEVIRDMQGSLFGRALALKEITSWFIDRHQADYQKPITPKWVGWLIRKKLGLKTHKSHGTFLIPQSEVPKLERLYERYGVTAEAADASDESAESTHGGLQEDSGAFRVDFGK